MLYDNNPEHQRIADEFVSRHVIYCASTLVYEIGQMIDDSSEYYDDFLSICVSERVCEDQYRYVIDHDERGEFRATVYAIDRQGEEKEWRSIDTEEAEFLALEGVDLHDPESIFDYWRSVERWTGPAHVINAWDDPETETWEAFEHWIVDGYLASLLEEQGEMVCRDFFGLTIWGRTSTGQAISMDGVIWEILNSLPSDHWVNQEAA